MSTADSLNSFARIVRTAVHLRPIQIYDRVRRHVLPARLDLRPAPALRPVRGAFVTPCKRTRSLYGDRFRVLNVERPIVGSHAWNDGEASKLWLYNLHYFDDLLSEDAASRCGEHELFLARWIAENAPGSGSGWEPYPTSLRIVNWIKWALCGGTLTQRARDSLAVQARYLAQSLEYHLLANHLFANAKALVFAGLFFDGPEAASWLQTGGRLLARELPEQILGDGGHFELSPTYHAVIAEDVLDLINLAAMYKRPDRLGLRSIAGRMLDWLVAMTRPDGLPPFFNDAAYGVSPALEQLVGYARALVIDPPRMPGQGKRFLRESGYVRVAVGPAVLFADVGEVGPSYNPGHAHCDMLSLELAIEGRPVLVNTGTSTYDMGARRTLERGTAAHNTVQVDDAEQSEIWGAFRVGRRARPRVLDIGDDHLEASHDGFAPLGVRHARRFSWAEGRIVVEDKCTGSHRRATARFHLHPDIAPGHDGDTIVLGKTRVSFDGATDVKIESYEYAPEFNRRTPARMIVAHFDRRLRTDIVL